MNFKARFVFAWFIFSSIWDSARADESAGLIIHASEIGIAKFHRHDHSVRPYEHNNLWRHYALSPGANTVTPQVRDNDDQSVTVIFSNLDELFTSLQNLAESKGKKIDVLNISAHGLPGAMWFPSDQARMNSNECASWRKSAEGDDKANYEQYYSALDASEIKEIRALANLPSLAFMTPCTTGTSEFGRIRKKHAKLASIFSADAQIHFFSCVVGLGWAGKRFVYAVASQLLSGENSKVQAAMNFGLGDWSMPEGMGFWDYQNSEQLERDNRRYPVDRKDRDIMQKGSVRMAIRQQSEWKVGIVSGLDFMLGTKDDLRLIEQGIFDAEDVVDAGSEQQFVHTKNFSVRIPGTHVRVPVTFKD